MEFKRQENLDRGRQKLFIVRDFKVSRELLWRAWTEPEILARWFGPEDSTLSDVKMDVRAAGIWSAVMHIPGIPDIPWHAEYQEVVKPEKLGFIMKNPEDNDDANVETVSVFFEGEEEKTRMILTQTGYLPREQYETGLKMGWNTFFDRLEVLLTELK